MLLFSAALVGSVAMLTGGSGDQSNDAEARRLLTTLSTQSAWENWASMAQVLRRDGADPGPWRNSFHPGLERFELITPADFPGLRRIVNGHWVTVRDPFATADKLVEVRLNSISYQYTRAQELYTVEGQRRAVAQGDVNFPVGSIQLKAAWRRINASQRSRYHTMTLHLASGARLYGLTAINLAVKTPNGWLWASFEHTDAPPHSALSQHLRLRGVQTAYVDAANQPVLLGNTELEAQLGAQSSCMTCHARATINVNAGDIDTDLGMDPNKEGGRASVNKFNQTRLPVFAPAPSGVRRSYVGTPDPHWFGQTDAAGHWRPTYAALDFVWSLAQAAEQGPTPQDRVRP